MTKALQKTTSYDDLGRLVILVFCVDM